MQAWATIAADPVVAAELARREATVRHRWTGDYQRSAAAALDTAIGHAGQQDSTNRLAAEAVLIDYARRAAATEQAWQAKPAKTAEPDAGTAADWAMNEPRARPTGRPAPSSGPSMR